MPTVVSGHQVKFLLLLCRSLELFTLNCRLFQPSMNQSESSRARCGGDHSEPSIGMGYGIFRKKNNYYYYRLLTVLEQERRSIISYNDFRLLLIVSIPLSKPDCMRRGA